MNLSNILLSALQQLWYLVPILLLVGVFKSRWFKGVLGEFLVNILLSRLPERDYTLIKDVTLPTDGGTTQIDHIVVSRFGIFIIETKNLKGWIFGSAYQKQWTQKIYRQTYRFQNPLHQNYKHVKTLANLLGCDDSHLHSVIVFIGDSTFKTPMPPSVTYARGCVQYIKQHTEVVFTMREHHQLVATINQIKRKRGIVTNIKHRQHVRAKVREKQH